MIEDFHKQFGYFGRIEVDKENEDIKVYIPENKIVDQPEKNIVYFYEDGKIVKCTNGVNYELECSESLFRLCVSCDLIYESNKSNFPLNLSCLVVDEKVMGKFSMEKLSKHGDAKKEEVIMAIDRMSSYSGKDKAIEFAMEQEMFEEYKILLEILHYGIN